MSRGKGKETVDLLDLDQVETAEGNSSYGSDPFVDGQHENSHQGQDQSQSPFSTDQPHGAFTDPLAEENPYSGSYAVSLDPGNPFSDSISNTSNLRPVGGSDDLGPNIVRTDTRMSDWPGSTLAHGNVDDDGSSFFAANTGDDDHHLYNVDSGIEAPSMDKNGIQWSTAGKHRSRISGVVDEVKNRLGLAYQYQGVDLPLTELDRSNSNQPLPAEHIHQVKQTVQRNRRSKFPTSVQEWQDLFSHLGRKKVDPSTLGPRIIHLNDKAANRQYGHVDNHISTTKYNVATFLPKFLIEQFSKYANLFFLATAAIQQVPNVTPTNRYTTAGTLLVVLMVSAVKESIEDFKRFKADRELNEAPARVLDNGTFVAKKWIDVCVGDIVRVESEEAFPADLVLLASSEPEGLCYIETANLDGETNLKIKQAISETSGLVDPEVLGRMQGQITSEHPNSSLYTYEATLSLKDPQSDRIREIPLNPDQLLLRGATLRNTPWIHGIVVFTGHETKLIRNASAAPIKRTAMEKALNTQIAFLFFILIVISLVSSFGDVILRGVQRNKMWYVMIEGQNLFGLFFLDLLTYWVLFSNLVPISLFVTVEIVKYYQAFLISSDLEMYYPVTDTATVCRTSSLVEELGQIDYIFSDKTGTLTRNIMEFKGCSIAGVQYADEIPEDKRPITANGQTTGVHSLNEIRNNLDKLPDKPIINQFLILLAACHTVIPEIIEGELDTDGLPKIRYQAASPDEGALVAGAASLGYKFYIRKPKSIVISVQGRDEEYELLNICEFNSTRKRMSAIFRCADGKIRLYCKGADTVIFERLSPDNDLVDVTTTHLEDYASDGLRTLCLAMREIPDDEYAAWSSIYDKASITLNNRSEEMDKAAELIEKDLSLLGATAIEDKLQEGVPETIHTLQEAGIKIWVLTGDRQETAINIGMSCKLVSEDMSLLIINEETKEETRDNIQKKLTAIREHDVGGAELETLALVIDGHSLEFALEPDLEGDFLALAILCKACICCRVSPLQKALVVKLVKRGTDSLLLAIGDGANDVSMIQAAHVGVGISGMEGMQAARSADISIGQFRYLRKLLLVHGAWSYQRLSRVILYSFYKNIALYMTQFWFVFFNAFTGQTIFESWMMTFYNVIFTALPPFVLGICDQFISARLLDRYPQLYQLGRSGVFFNTRSFVSWVLNGFYHSIILFVGSILAYDWSAPMPNGTTTDHWVWGSALYTFCLATVIGKAALVSNIWTKYTIIAIPGSLAFYIGFFPAYAGIAPKVHVSLELRGVISHLYTSLIFWALFLLLPMACLLRDVAWKYSSRMYFPKSYHHVQEIQKYQIADYRPRMEQFQKAIRKVRQVQRMKKQRGYAFSQTDEGQARLVRAYDTTVSRGRYGEMKTL